MRGPALTATCPKFGLSKVPPEHIDTKPKYLGVKTSLFSSSPLSQSQAQLTGEGREQHLPGFGVFLESFAAPAPELMITLTTGWAVRRDLFCPIWGPAGHQPTVEQLKMSHHLLGHTVPPY